MFQSYEYIKYLGYNVKTKEHSYQYKIVDSDFEEVGVGVEVGVAVAVGVGDAVAVAVAEVYKKRGYTESKIAKQIFLSYRYSAKRYGWSLEETVSWSKEYTPQIWKTYGQYIKKYLLFS